MLENQTQQSLVSPDQAREELINHMTALCGRIKYHQVDAYGVEYLDEDGITLLVITQVKPPDINGNVTWGHHFVETDEYYEFTENIFENGLAERPA